MLWPWRFGGPTPYIYSTGKVVAHSDNMIMFWLMQGMCLGRAILNLSNLCVVRPAFIRCDADISRDDITQGIKIVIATDFILIFFWC